MLNDVASIHHEFRWVINHFQILAMAESVMSATAGRRAHGEEIQESARLQTQRKGRIEGGTAHGKEKQESACPDTQRSGEFEGARKFLGQNAAKWREKI